MGYRIGLILGTKSVDYLRMIRLGVQNTLENSGHTLVCFADLIPYHTRANILCSLRVVFELARSMDLDAVIVPAGTTCGYLGNDLELAQEMIHLLDPNKTIVMERNMPGYRCITKDSRTGMRACIRHLIEEGRYKRIAFISGAATSKGAHDREQAYFDEMAAHGLQIPNGYFVRGDFSGNCRDVIEQLLDEHSHIEAIACASDQIAFTLYEVMRERMLEAGRDIAVTGFDGVQDTAHLDPPLATVNMTGYDFGAMAAREAIRLCDGLPQQETTQTGDFVPRESCGTSITNSVDQLVKILRVRPFPMDDVVSLAMDSSLHMANAELTANFRKQLKTLVSETFKQFEYHLAHPDEDVVLFSSFGLADLFSLEYRKFFSLEGFHSTATSLLKALAILYPDQKTWLDEQASFLHLHVARLLDSNIKSEVYANHLREWHTLHLTEDALREDDRPQEAYRLMLADLDHIGVRWADLFVLSDAADVMKTTSFVLTNTLRHVGSLTQGTTTVDEVTSISLRELLDYSLSRHDATKVCSVGGILAGDELLGLVTMDAGALDDNGQLVALINMGLALKHLQNMAHIREMNDVLSRNNLQLARQSQRDEMTGLLNRRGLHERVLHRMLHATGQTATLLYLDLDGLKYINDTFGHDIGDAAIRDTARALKRSLPSDCLLARMGGDEFVAFFLVHDEEEARAYITEIEKSLEHANEIHGTRNVPYSLSISIGLSCFCIGNDCEADLSHAMLQADERMYRVKRQHHQSRR